MSGTSFFLLSRKEQLRLQWHRMRGAMSRLLRRIQARLPAGATIPDKQRYTIAKKGELYDFFIGEQRITFPTAAEPKVTILLIFWNRAELSLACLKSIAATVTVPYEVVIIDNHSTDETALLLNRIDNARIVKNDDNVGFLRACNQGAALARGDALLLLNNDTQLHCGAVDSAYQTLVSSADIGAVGGKIVLLDGTLQEAGSIMWSDGSCLGFGRGMHPEDPATMYRRDVDYCSGAFLMTLRALFNDLKGFDERYAPAYYEETDYCARLLTRGMRIVYEPKAVLTHYEFGSAGVSDNAIAQMQKNQVIFAEQHKALLADQYPPDVANVWRARAHRGGINLLYIDDRVPHRHYGSGFPRANDIVKQLLARGINITVVPYNFLHEEGWEEVYTDLPAEVEVLVGVSRHNINEIMAARSGLYDVIWVSRPHNMAHFRASVRPQYYDNAQVIYDAEAIFAMRAITQQAVSGQPMSARQQERLIQKELAVIQDDDIVITVSANEKALFDKHLKVKPKAVAVLGHLLEPAPTPTSFEGRSGFLFVGNLDYPDSPNVDSLLWFVEQVWPLVQEQLPDVTLDVVGSAKAEAVQALQSEHIRIHGRVEEVSAFYDRARVFIAPTRYAAGVPFKVHEACAYGVPCVVTDLLANQTGWLESGAVVAAPVGDAERFAEACMALHQRQAHWNDVRDTALKAVKEDCGIERYWTALQFLD